MNPEPPQPVKIDFLMTICCLAAGFTFILLGIYGIIFLHNYNGGMLLGSIAAMLGLTSMVTYCMEM
jgi:hypothetical protein